MIYGTAQDELRHHRCGSVRLDGSKSQARLAQLGGGEKAVMKGLQCAFKLGGLVKFHRNLFSIVSPEF